MSYLGTLPTLDPLGGSPEESTFSYLPATAVASPVASSQPYPSVNGIPDFSQQLSNVAHGGSPTGASGGISLLNLPISRVVAIVLGLILIGAGLLLFRPTQEIIARGVEATSV